LLLLLGATSLGCGVVGLTENVAGLDGVAYWTAQTETPRPTVTVFLGTTTPVYADTPVPAEITTTPFWTTVTATPIAPPPTATPFGFVATPYWVTTTPFIITETPVPPVTTTPALPIIGFTTPEPLQTPYYRVGSFYMHSDVYIGGPNGLAVRLTGHETEATGPGGVYHYLTVRVTNYGSAETIAPVSDVLFVRHVRQGETLVTGRWVAQNEPLIARGLPSYDAQQLTPLMPDESREYVIGFVLPAGEVEQVGLITNWRRPVEGGLPVWFFLRPDPLGPFVDAYKPPPPTPVLMDDDLASAGGGGPGDPGPGTDRIWPTTGIVTRGFGCAEEYTGIDGSGYGCPPERPWFHNGVDIANVAGTLVWSPVDGNLTYAGPDTGGADCSDIPGSQPPHEGLGNYQRVAGGDDSVHYLGHLQAFLLTAGPVTAGMDISEMGSTGCSTGPHLHWTVYQNGSLVDPAVWAGPGP